MNWLGLIIVLLGTCYLLYSLICRKKVTIYNRNVKIIKGKEEEYFKLQLLFSLVNSMWIIVVGLLVIKYKITNPAVILSVIIFHFVNLLLKVISKRKDYITQY